VWPTIRKHQLLPFGCPAGDSPVHSEAGGSFDAVLTTWEMPTKPPSPQNRDVALSGFVLSTQAFSFYRTSMLKAPPCHSTKGWHHFFAVRCFFHVASWWEASRVARRGTFQHNQ
jgi:hypothetical protein